MRLSLMGSLAFVYVDKGVFNIEVLLHHLRSNQVGLCFKNEGVDFLQGLSLSFLFCHVWLLSCEIVFVFVLSGCFTFLTSYDCVSFC